MLNCVIHGEVTWLSSEKNLKVEDDGWGIGQPEGRPRTYTERVRRKCENETDKREVPNV